MGKFKSYHQFNENIADLFRSAHAAIDPDELIPLEDLIGNPRFPTEEEFLRAIEYLEIDPQYLYYNPKDIISPFMYWDGIVYEPFHGQMNMEAFKMFQTRERLKYKLEKSEKLVKSKKYSELFQLMDKKVLIPSFVQMYKDIPDKDKYEIFKDLYVRSEYGFQSFPVEIIKDCFSKRKLSPEWKKRSAEFKKKAKLNPDGTITLYRGENVDSAKSDDAFSWTLDKKTAKFFADRFSKGSGRIVEKTVSPEEVIDYLDDRGESEVILFPKKFGKLNEFLNENVGFSNIKAADYDFHFILGRTWSSKRPEGDMEVIADENINFAAFKLKDMEVIIRAKDFESEGITELGFFKLMKEMMEENPNSPYIAILMEEIPSFIEWWKKSNEKFKSYLKGKEFGI
jgi:hypothetical protein